MPFVCPAESALFPLPPMQPFRRPPQRIRGRRNGLAPVELVLAIPIWMLLASAMVIVGNLGTWKIRGHLAVREGAARGLWPRTRMGDAQPGEWRRNSAGLRGLSASPIDLSDPLQLHVVVRGPQFVVPGGSLPLTVDSTLMESRSRAVAGEAFLNEPAPLWPRSGVRMRYAREYPILDGNCGIWAAGENGDLRAPRLWSLPPIQ